MPLVADTSSDMFSRPIDVAKYGLIYAGAQKNLGPSGVTLVIVRDDLLARTPKTLPTMLQYGVHAENKSLYNTPPVFGIYIMRPGAEVAAEAGRAGGDERAQRAQGGQALRRDRPHAASTAATPQKDSRSRMNVTFRLPSEELEKKFAKESTAAGLDGLKGPPLGRRPARVDLQRLPRGRGRRARRSS